MRDRDEVVAVNEPNISAFCLVQPGVPCRAETAVLRVLYQTGVRQAGLAQEAFEDFEAPVGGFVLHEDQLNIRHQTAEVLKLPEKVADKAFDVVDRNQNADGWVLQLRGPQPLPTRP